MHGGDGGPRMTGPMWMPDAPPTLERLLAVHLQPIPLLPVLALLGLVAYLTAVWALHRRGIAWSWGRTVSWVAGILVIQAVTATGIEGYGMLLFSVHMGQHMALVMVAPILLLLGSPVALALRALSSTGRPGRVRGGLVRLLHSRFLRVGTSVPVRWFLFLSGLYGIYFTDIFDVLMATVWGHNLMLVHFLLTGLLFFGPLVAVDPWPHVASPVIRMVETFLSAPFHAFFGVAVMTATTPVVEFFSPVPSGWGIDLIADQEVAGGIAWVTSEVPTLMVIGIILIQWVRSDEREARRIDRRADRDDDAALAAYNARLRALAEQDARLAQGHTTPAEASRAAAPPEAGG